MHGQPSSFWQTQLLLHLDTHLHALWTPTSINALHLCEHTKYMRFAWPECGVYVNKRQAVTSALLWGNAANPVWNIVDLCNQGHFFITQPPCEVPKEFCTMRPPLSLFCPKGWFLETNFSGTCNFAHCVSTTMNAGPSNPDTLGDSQSVQIMYDICTSEAYFEAGNVIWRGCTREFKEERTI